MTPSSPTRRRRRHVAILALVVCCAMWGTSFPLVKALNHSVDAAYGVEDHGAVSVPLRLAAAAWILAVRFAVALVIFGILFHRIVRRATAFEHGVGAAMAVFFFGGLMMQVYGLATIPASRSGFLTSLTVVLTPLATTLIRRRLPRWTVAAGVSVSAIGVAVLTGMVTVGSDGVAMADNALALWTIGDTVTVGSTFFFTAHVLLLDHFGRDHDPVAMTPAMFGVTAVAAGCLLVSLGGRIPEAASVPSEVASMGSEAASMGSEVASVSSEVASVSSEAASVSSEAASVSSEAASVTTAASTEAAVDLAWTSILLTPDYLVVMGLLCVFPSVISFALMNRYQTELTATQAAVIYTTEPIFVVIAAMFLPGMIAAIGGSAGPDEVLTREHCLGGGLILVANTLALWHREPVPAAACE